MLSVILTRGLAAVVVGLALVAAVFLMAFFVTEGVVFVAGIACALFIEWVFM